MTLTTENQAQLEASFHLGDWSVEPRLNRLSRGDKSIQIELKMMDVLVCLAARPGDLVTRQEIIDAVWAIDFISEGTLTRIVAQLRRALGDDARQPRYIETIHSKGYRLIAAVEAQQKATATVTPFPARVGEEGRDPYPGLAAFTEADTEFFFGREAEVAHLWRKITSRRLLAVIGPSGVGKTSFLRAGLIAGAPEGWGILLCQPGEAPFAAMARELAPQFEGDAETISKLVEIGDENTAVAVISRWREHHDQGLLIVDQFEELFTRNAPDDQARVAVLLRRLAEDADVNVLVSMRDDFLYRCHAYPQLRPIFDSLSPLEQPNRASLRRALEQPAARLGYSFEDDLLDKMLDALAEEERSALPLLAFAVARLWDLRDRDRRLLTRQAFEDIGGVGGALARHAEATLKAIGSDRIPLVRELFRNLVTADGTRAARDWDDLLSVFSDSRSESPEEILRRLIDARLLTSYEVREGDEEPTRGVEVAHESLLTSWPRLVRWQTQDADAAQIRDQLRQAARTWDEHDRADDTLWTGSAYREFAVWLEHYPGGLTDTEEAFGEAMTRHAERRRRRRRAAATVTIVVLFGVLAIIGGFWRRSVTEARRAEAATLFSLAQLQIEDHPTGAIAYAIASLELADSAEMRRLVIDALSRGPTEFRLETNSFYHLDFSSDGRWLATAAREGGGRLWPSAGGPPTTLEGSDAALEIRFSPRGDLVVGLTSTVRNELGIWSVPEGRLLRTIAFEDRGSTYFFELSADGERLITGTQIAGGEATELVIRSWPVGEGEPDVLARLQIDPLSNYVLPDLDPMGSRLAWADGRAVRIAPLVGATLDLASATVIQHDRAVAVQMFDSTGLRMATVDMARRIRIWSLERVPPEVTHTLELGERDENAGWCLDPSGSMLAGCGGVLWDLTAPPDAEPLPLSRSAAFGWGLAFDPKGKWVATGGYGPVSLWPLARTYPRVLRGHQEPVFRVAFTPDSEGLISTSHDGSVRVWPLVGGSGERSRILDQAEGTSEEPGSVAVAPDGSFVAVGFLQGPVKVLPLDGAPGRELSGFTDAVYAIAVGPESRLVAAGAGSFFPEEANVRVWDLESEEVRVLDAGDGTSIQYLWFTAEGDLWVRSGDVVIRRWALDGDQPQMVEEIDFSYPDYASDYFFDLDPDGRQVLLFGEPDRLWIRDLDTHVTRMLNSFGPLGRLEFDPTGKIVVNGSRGAIQVGEVAGGEPHLLPGRKGGYNIAVSPDGRWIASGAEENTIRIWPMPDLSKPPLHTLPRDELIAKLKTLTNLRAVSDPDSPSGWKIEVGPFPGWETVPTW